MHAKPARTCTRTGEPVHSNTHGWAQQRVQRRRRAGKCGAATQPCALLLRGLAERKVQERQEPREGRGRAPDCTGAGGDSRIHNAWLDTGCPGRSDRLARRISGQSPHAAERTSGLNP